MGARKWYLTLPIDPLVPEIVDHLRDHNALVLEAPPGAGKTTRVPPALLGLGERDVIVLEPRRLAARLAARFVAAERGERVGDSVGYQVRFEEVAGPHTRLRFLTEGVLTRRLLSDPSLDRVGVVVLDEFHERHLEGDLALALLRRLQQTLRPDLRLVVMSATLHAQPIAEYLGGARVIRSEGRQHPLEIEYTPHSAMPLEQQVASAMERLRDTPGHVLVFLPGAYEIRVAQSACAPLAQRHDWVVLPLHGDQSPEEQDRAVGPSKQRKVILSTNVAESSITIEDIGAVVDSGLSRIAGHSPWSGLPTLQVGRISQASANQRAGRAGRTRAGRVIRLYPLDDFVRRPPQDSPEIARADLAPMFLQLRAMGNPDLEWLDPPPAASIEHAQELVGLLAPTPELIREMSRYPLHPRLSRLIVEARREGVAEDGCTVAALLSAGERLPSRPDHATRSDLLVLMESQWEPRTAQVVRQIRRIVDPPRQRARNEDALLRSVLAAFPDRVAKRRQGGALQLAGGGPAQLAPASTVTGAEFLVAVEAEDRRDQKTPLVRIASAIEPEWLLDFFPEQIREVSEASWNKQAGRVEAVNALMFDQIVIQQSRGPADPNIAATILAQKAMEAGRHQSEDLDAFLARAAFAGIDGVSVEDAMRALASGARSLEDIDITGLIRVLEQQLPASQRRQLDTLAPERIRLPGGRQVKVHYEPGQPPWIASRLQDFHGMTATPMVGRGVPVVVRLLAPNNRPVQMTTDLAGFWERLYPELRKQLSRRYPKHHWP